MIDTHTHIADKLIRNDIDKVVNGFKADGIELIVENGYDVDSSRFAVELSERYEGIRAAVGIHPEYASRAKDSDFEAIRALATHEKVVAIGEIGLDYHYEGYDKTAQKGVMIKQILLADELGLPVVFHIRDAYEDAENIMREYADNLKNGVLLHCYSGSKEMLDRYAFLDPYVAFGGAITFKNNKRGDVIRAVKSDRLVAETDCPYLSPTPFRGKLNYPANVRYVIERLAEELGITFEECEKLTSNNAKRFYKIAK